MKKWTLRFRAEDKPLFEAIKEGRKTVETRAGTTKYRPIKAGDILIFVCQGEKFERCVGDVQHFSTIESLFKAIDRQHVMPGISSLEEAERIYYGYAGYKEKIEQYGLIAFTLDAVTHKEAKWTQNPKL